MIEMNWLDIVLVVVLAVGTFLGLRMGIIKAVLSLVGVIVGVVLAGQYYVALANVLPFFSETSDAAKIVSFAIILIVVMVIATMAARFLKWAASVIMLNIKAQRRVEYKLYSDVAHRFSSVLKLFIQAFLL